MNGNNFFPSMLATRSSLLPLQVFFQLVFPADVYNFAHVLGVILVAYENGVVGDHHYNALDADQGRFLGFVRLVARRRDKGGGQ